MKLLQTTLITSLTFLTLFLLYASFTIGHMIGTVNQQVTIGGVAYASFESTRKRVEKSDPTLLKDLNELVEQMDPKNSEDVNVREMREFIDKSTIP